MAQQDRRAQPHQLPPVGRQRPRKSPNITYPWGLGVFDVDSGGFPGDKTTMTFTCYHTSA